MRELTAGGGKICVCRGVLTCFMGRRTTGWSPRSLLPSMTSSLASTVPRAGHQFTGTSAWYARPRLNSWQKIHCVHL